MSQTHASSPVFRGRAVFRIRPERVSQFRHEVAKIIAPTRSEKGVIRYEAYQLRSDSGELTNRFEFHELWVSREAMLVDHKEHTPHMRTFFKKIGIGTAHSWVEGIDISGDYVDELD